MTKTHRAADKREEFLRKIGHKLQPEEQTEFNIDRWLEAYDQDINRCAAAVEEYVNNRKALGLESPDAFEDFYARPDIKHYCALFPQSKLDINWVNGHDNGIVFVEMGPREPTKTAKLIRTGQFLRAFFAWLESMHRLVLEQERRSGKRSWAVCIFDMSNVPSIFQYANPMGAINRIFEMRVHLAMAYYAEMLSHVVIMNPPRFLGILFKIISFILPAKIIGRFHIAQNVAEAERWISADAIPVGLGGKKPIEPDLLPNGCIPPPKREFTEDHFLHDGQIWLANSIDIENVQREIVMVKPGHSFVRTVNARPGQKLLYELLANRTFELSIQNERGDYLVPHLRLCTPQLAEEGEILIFNDNHGKEDQQEDIQIRVEVKNVHKIFTMRLIFAIQLIN